MAASAGEVELVDLSAADDAPGPPRTPRRRSRRRAPVLAAALVALALVVAGAWQHRAALEAQRAADRAAAQEAQLHAGRARANALEQRLLLVRSASRAVAAAALGADGPSGGAAGASPGSAGPGADELVWWPADLGPRAAHLDEPVDLQVVGTWPAPQTGEQQIGYRLVDGLPSTSGGSPCQVPAVRPGAWGGDPGEEALPCRVMAAGVRGTAVLEGTSGAGASQVQVREVVLVSDGRAAAVAVWSSGGAPLPLGGPALGAAAAALLAAGRGA